MSKQRAQARAAREQAAREAAERARARAERDAAEQRRRERLSLVWRRNRLWQHGASFRRNKERWAALGTLIMVLLLIAYLLTSSITAVLFVALVIVIASPALVMLFFDRSRK